MGLWSFVKDAGKKVFGGGDDTEVTGAALQDELKDLEAQLESLKAGKEELQEMLEEQTARIDELQERCKDAQTHRPDAQVYSHTHKCTCALKQVWKNNYFGFALTDGSLSAPLSAWRTTRRQNEQRNWHSFGQAEK